MKTQKVALVLSLCAQLLSLESFSSVTGYEKHCGFPNSGKMLSASDTFSCIGSGATEVPISIGSAASNLTTNMSKKSNDKEIYQRAAGSALRMMDLAQAGALDDVLQRHINHDENLKNAIDLLDQEGIQGNAFFKGQVIIDRARNDQP